ERTVLFDTPSEINARILLASSELDVGIGLVVAEQDVELRPVFLDQIVLEGQGFAFVADDNGLQVGDFARERASFGVNPARLNEIGAHAAAEVARFANVEHRFARVLEKVPPGASGKVRGFFARRAGK